MINFQRILDKSLVEGRKEAQVERDQVMQGLAKAKAMLEEVDEQKLEQLMYEHGKRIDPASSGVWLPLSSDGPFSVFIKAWDVVVKEGCDGDENNSAGIDVIREYRSMVDQYFIEKGLQQSYLHSDAFWNGKFPEHFMVKLYVKSESSQSYEPPKGIIKKFFGWVACL